jgi:cytidylate kinase
MRFWVDNLRRLHRRLNDSKKFTNRDVLRSKAPLYSDSMKLIIIEGSTSTGKSTLARRLSKDLGISAFLRDDYKEHQYDLAGGRPSLRRMAKIDADSRRQLAAAITQACKSDTSLIVESNFAYSEKYKIKSLIPPNVTVVEVFCFAKGSTVLKRYVARNRSGERHKGHRDHLWYSAVAFESLGPIKLKYRPFKLTKNVLLVDANDLSKIDYGAIRDFVIQANS